MTWDEYDLIRHKTDYDEKHIINVYPGCNKQVFNDFVKVFASNRDIIRKKNIDPNGYHLISLSQQTNILDEQTIKEEEQENKYFMQNCDYGANKGWDILDVIGIHGVVSVGNRFLFYIENKSTQSFGDNYDSYLLQCWRDPKEQQIYDEEHTINVNQYICSYFGENTKSESDLDNEIIEDFMIRFKSHNLTASDSDCNSFKKSVKETINKGRKILRVISDGRYVTCISIIVPYSMPELASEHKYVVKLWIGYFHFRKSEKV